MKPLLTLTLFLFIQISFAFENHPAGARASALSNAFVSFSDTWSTFHNQAGLSKIKYFSAAIHYESRFMVDELSFMAISTTLPFKGATFALCHSQFGKEIFKTSKTGLAFARQLAQNLHGGIQLDYFSRRIPENRKTFVFGTFEAGFIYHFNKKLFIGTHVFNPISNGFKMHAAKETLPPLFRFGGHYNFDNNILVTAETQKNGKDPFQIKTGIEFSPAQRIVLRIGILGNPVKFTTGIGLLLNNVSTDIAFSSHGHLGITPSISMHFNL